MHLFIRKMQMEVATPAIIMAIGIVIIGVFPYVMLPSNVEKIFIILFLSIAIILYFLLFLTFIHLPTLVKSLKHPNKSFAFGTWVASLTVFTTVFHTYFPNQQLITYVLSWINICFFFILVFVFIYSFFRIIKNRMNTDGIILLATVSTQSIVIMVYEIYNEKLIALVIIGIIFYFLSIYLIIKRYWKHEWNLADDWANSNCIIHGALSITGFALVKINLLPIYMLTTLWIITFVLILVIECIECARFMKRVKKYAIRHGVLTYHITQWSRNFTFGMFFTFTYYLHLDRLGIVYPHLYMFIKYFLSFWMLVVLSILFIQISLWLFHLITSVFRRKKQSAEQVSC